MGIFLKCIKRPWKFNLWLKILTATKCNLCANKATEFWLKKTREKGNSILRNYKTINWTTQSPSWYFESKLLLPLLKWLMFFSNHRVIWSVLQRKGDVKELAVFKQISFSIVISTYSNLFTTEGKVWYAQFSKYLLKWADSILDVFVISSISTPLFWIWSLYCLW